MKKTKQMNVMEWLKVSGSFMWDFKKVSGKVVSDHRTFDEKEPAI